MGRVHRSIVLEPGGWDAWVAEHPQGSFLQTRRWADLKARFGWESVRLGVTQDGELVAGAQVLFRRLPLGALAYAPRGPIGLGEDPDATASLLAALHGSARDRGAFCLKVEPPVSGGAAVRLLGAAGFVPSRPTQPRSTLVVDLSASPSALWTRLSPGVRYNVRLARRHGLRVVDGRGDDLGAFYRLLAQTAARAGFGVHCREYYEAAWEHLASQGQARLALAELDGEPLAAALTLTAGRRAFHVYAGSSLVGRQLKPNDLLHWEVIRRAQADGFLSYDLWGIPDAVGRAAEAGGSTTEIAGAGDGLWGVYRFKSGFGGEVVRYVGAFDYACAPARYRLWTSAQSGLGELRRLTRLAGRPCR